MAYWTAFLAAVLMMSLCSCTSGPPRTVGPIVLVANARSESTCAHVGVVVAGGNVVAPLHDEGGNRVDVVIGPDGTMYPCLGVLDYRLEDENLLCLLAIDWQGAAPATVEVATEPPKGGELRLVRFVRGDESQPIREDMVGAATTGLFEADSYRMVGMIPRAGAGGPVLNETGRLVGIQRGVCANTADFAPYLYLDVTRPEIVSSLKPGELISWQQWSEFTERDARRAFAEAVENAGKELEPKEAADRAEALVALDSRCALAWRQLGVALVRLKDYEHAEAAVARALDLIPTDVVALGVRATCLVHTEQPEAALACAERAVAVAPDDTNVFSVLGYVLAALHRNPEAAEAQRRAIAIAPDNDYARRELARLERLAEGEKKETLEFDMDFRLVLPPAEEKKEQPGERPR